MAVIQFVLLIGVTCLLVVFLFSGVIGYFFYSLSHGTPSPEVTAPQFPRWEDLPTIPRDILLPAITMLTAIWVLVAPPKAADDRKMEDSKKGRGRRRYYDED